MQSIEADLFRPYHAENEQNICRLVAQSSPNHKVFHKQIFCRQQAPQIERYPDFLFCRVLVRRVTKKCIAALRENGRDDVFLTFPEWKKTNCTTSLVLKTPKTDSSIRNIYIPKSVVLALEENRKQQEQMKADLANEYQDYNIVVAQNNGRPYEEHQIAQKLKALITEHNLKPVVFHSLRHSSTSLKLRISGGDIKAVQGDTGHAQANMVTDVYSHIFDSDRKHLARKVNDEFFSAEKPKAAEPIPAVDESTQKLIQLLQSSPEQATKLLRIYEVLGGNA